MKGLRTALSFLTILPWRSGTDEPPLPLGASAGWFPLVGGLIGLLSGLAYAGLSPLLPPLPAAVLAAALWIGLTGGLHLDGLADCCDGLLAAVPRERRLEIMKDPRLGTFGGLGLLLAVLLKIGLLTGLPPARAVLGLPLAAALGRWLILPLSRLPSARPGGMGAAFAGGVTRRQMGLALVWLLPLAALNGWRGLAALLLAHLTAWLIARLALSRIGGVSGDVFGLAVEAGELSALLALAVHTGV
jgi:adenosylcobinamide-GDP ribazoletransferase